MAGDLRERLTDSLLSDASKHATAVRLFASTFAAIFAVEFLIMLFIDELDLSPLLHGLLDASLLVALLFPFLFFLVYVPLAQARNIAQASEQRLQAIMNNTPALIFLKDRNGRYRFVNDHCLEVLQMSRDEVLGSTDYDLFPHAVADTLLENNRKVLAAEGPLAFEETIVTRSGNHTYIATKLPLRNADGSVYGLCGIASDISERKAVEDQLRRFQAILESTSDFIGIADKDGKIWYANRALRRARGIGPKDDVTATRIQDYHPAATFESIRNEAIPTAMREGIWQGETQFLGKGGRLIPTIQVIMAHRSKNGELEYLSTSARDIGDRLSAEQALRDSEAKYRALFETAQDGILLCKPHNDNHAFVDCNPRMLAMLKARRGDLIGKTPADISPPTQPDGRPSPEKALEKLHAALEGVPQSFEWQYRRTDGTALDTEVSLNRIELGNEYCVQGIVRDITERKRAAERILHMAHYDQLTGLPNRVLFYDRLEQALAKARRSVHGVAVFFLDLDGFKAVNDTLGHEMGDKLLKDVAARLQGCVREIDTVARMGGDEFTFVLSDIHDPRDASKIADKVLIALDRPFAIDDHGFCIGASIGIALSPGDGQDRTTLLQRADAAMFRAKREGSNAYRFYSQGD